MVPSSVATMALLGRVSPAAKLRLDVLGRPRRHGYAVMNPAAEGATAVRLTATAVDREGSAARRSNTVVDPAATRRDPPTPDRVSTARVGPTGTIRESPDGPSQPVTSTRMSAAAKVYTHTSPLGERVAMALFATVWPAAWLSTDASGTLAVHG